MEQIGIEQVWYAWNCRNASKSCSNTGQLAGQPIWFILDSTYLVKQHIKCMLIMSRNGGGWVLCAHVRTSTCQDHMTNAVRISGTTGPRTTDTSTSKMADAWIQALVNGSTYNGSTRYWMEATGFNKNVFIDSSATVDLLDLLLIITLELESLMYMKVVSLIEILTQELEVSEITIPQVERTSLGVDTLNQVTTVDLEKIV